MITKCPEAIFRNATIDQDVCSDCIALASSMDSGWTKLDSFESTLPASLIKAHSHRLTRLLYFFLARCLPICLAIIFSNVYRPLSNEFMIAIQSLSTRNHYKTLS